MGISIFFSSAIYRISTFEINRVESRIRTRELRRPNLVPPISISEDLLSEAKKNILNQLLFINLMILFGSSALSYWLSGKTLQPIHDTIESQKRFISDASHELKTPIASIKTGLEVYLRGKTKNQKTADSLISDTLVDINHLSNLTKQLLLLNTQNSVKKTTTKPVEVLENLLKKLQPLAHKKDITFNKNFTSNKLNLNTQAFEQVATIILDNAIKFSPVATEIKLIFKNKTLKIIDSGPGILAQDLPHIFDRFYQTDSSKNKSQNKGFGLGLSIAKQLCDQNNWTISCSSRPGTGSTFSVAL